MKTTKTRYLFVLFASLLLQLTACGEPVKKSVNTADIFNYTNEPVIDVFANGHWVGDAYPMNASGSPGGGGGVITGALFTVGEYEIKWTIGGPKGNPHLGEIRTARAELKEMPENARYFVVHIYPNNHVVLTAQYLPTELPQTNRLSEQTK